METRSKISLFILYGSKKFILIFFSSQIKKHAADSDLKIRNYEGVSKDYTLPNVLASFDIVIVSFETLRAELNYASEVVNFIFFLTPYVEIVLLIGILFRWIKINARCDTVNDIPFSVHP